MLRKPLFIALAACFSVPAHATLIRTPLSLVVESTATVGADFQTKSFSATGAQLQAGQAVNPNNTGAFALSPSGHTAAAAFMVTGNTTAGNPDFAGLPSVSFAALSTTETMLRQATIDYRIQYHFTKTDAGFHDVFYKIPSLDIDVEHLQLLNPFAGEELLASFNVGLKVDGSTVWSTGVAGALSATGLALTQTGTQYNVTSNYQPFMGFSLGDFGISERNLEIDLGVWAENETRLVEFFFEGFMESDAHSEITGSGSPSGSIGGDGFRGFDYRLTETTDPGTDDNGGGGTDDGTDGDTGGGTDDGTGGGTGTPVPAPSTLPLLAVAFAVTGFLRARRRRVAMGGPHRGCPAQESAVR